MKKTLQIFWQTSALALVFLLITPAPLLAATTQDTALAPILITEMQPGTTDSGSQEFIELYNQSTKTIDLTAGQWQVQITSSKATTWDGAKTVDLTGMFYPGTYMLLASSYTVAGASQSYLQDYASAQFSPGLTTSAGHIRVVHMVDDATVVSSRLEWSTANSGGYTAPAIDDASLFVLDSPIAAGSSIKRLTDATHIFADAQDISTDFATSPCPSPTANNVVPDQPLPDTLMAPLATVVDITNPLCQEPDTSTTQTTQDDQVIAPTQEPPAVLVPAEPEISAEDTKNTPSIPAADKGLAAPQITELLPNPGSPRTDSADEFVELYNSNAMAFDLSGFALEAGLTGNKHYIFPSGTTMAAHSFMAFFSADTKLSLSNSGGQVKLLDPLDNVLEKSDVYGAAKDDLAWARANGTWYWTTKPTPNAPNVISQPVAKTSKASSTKSKAKSTTAKSKVSSARAAKTKSTASDTTALASTTVADTPLHPLTLAVVGGFALLYGAYEYRHDMANKLYQLRRNREARREARRKPKRG